MKRFAFLIKDHDFAEVTLSDGNIIYVDSTLDIIQNKKTTTK